MQLVFRQCTYVYFDTSVLLGAFILVGYSANLGGKSLGLCSLSPRFDAHCLNTHGGGTMCEGLQLERVHEQEVAVLWAVTILELTRPRLG